MAKPFSYLKNILIFLAVAVFAIALFIPSKHYGANQLSLTVTAGEKSYFFSGLEIGNYGGKFYLKNAGEIVDGIYLDTVIRSKDAILNFNPNNDNPFSIEKEKTGLELDKAKLLSDIDVALNGGNGEVKGEFRVINPKTTKAEIEDKTHFRASFTTSYYSSTKERKHNVKLASSKISGTVLEENEEFSFNKVVGARLESRGFLPAKIIYNGDFVDGVGGGVCQVSTTLYNACLLSGLKITEHHPHSLNVSYVEPSFDAMVNSISSDLRFVNNTGGKIYITSIADEGKITISFYGLKQLERYERVSVTTEKKVFNEYLYEEDESLEDGAQIIARLPKGGIKSEGYLIKYVGDKRISNVKLRSDSYGNVKGVIRQGKKAN